MHSEVPKQEDGISVVRNRFGSWWTNVVALIAVANLLLALFNLSAQLRERLASFGAKSILLKLARLKRFL